MESMLSLDQRVIENELYRCVIDTEENVVTVTTDLGPDVARRIAEFEARKVRVSISLVFGVEGRGAKRHYLFRLRGVGCMEDTDESQTPTKDPYKDLVQKPSRSVGCAHSRRGDPATCSQCVTSREKAELVALIKAGKL